MGKAFIFGAPNGAKTTIAAAPFLLTSPKRGLGDYFPLELDKSQGLCDSGGWYCTRPFKVTSMRSLALRFHDMVTLCDKQNTVTLICQLYIDLHHFF